jgi:hypothetical protein
MLRPSKPASKIHNDAERMEMISTGLLFAFIALILLIHPVP